MNFSSDPSGQPGSRRLGRGSWLPAILSALLLIAALVGYVAYYNAVPTEPGFHAQACWFKTDIVGDAECGTLVVRENRQRADSRTIGLPVVILKAQGEEAEKGRTREPIIYLTGGPGDRFPFSSQRDMDSWSLWRKDFPPEHDLILVGPRGTGRHAVAFGCPEMRNAAISAGAHRPGDPPPDSRALALEAVTACARRLQSEGVDLTAYNSRESAADIAELRQALEIETAVLYGVSYGTRWALSILRYHPEGIAAAILDGLVPPEAPEGLEVAAFYRESLQQVFDDCAASSGCRRQFGDIEQRYERVRESLKARPLKLALSEYLDADELSALGDAEGRSISFDDSWFGWLLFDAIMDRGVPFLIPLLIDDIEQKRFATLDARLRESLLLILESQAYNSWAIYLSHICRDEAAFETPEAVAAAARAAGDLAFMVKDYAPNYLCASWPSGQADPLENQPVRSAVPTLLLSGRFDPLTPPVLAQRAAAHLSNSYLYTLAEKGHGALYDNACAQHLVRSFLRSFKRPTETHCQPQDLAVPAGN